MRDEQLVSPEPQDKSRKLSSTSGTVVRLAEPAHAEAIERLALAVQDWHVTGRPDLFKPGGCDTVAEIADRITSPGTRCAT